MLIPPSNVLIPIIVHYWWSSEYRTSCQSDDDDADNIAVLRIPQTISIRLRYPCDDGADDAAVRDSCTAVSASFIPYCKCQVVKFQYRVTVYSNYSPQEPQCLIPVPYLSRRLSFAYELVRGNTVVLHSRPVWSYSNNWP